MHDGGDSGHGRVRHPGGGSHAGSGRALSSRTLFELGVSEGIRLAESHVIVLVARFDGSVFDIPAIARRRGWDEQELTHMVFEFWGAGGHAENGGDQ